MLSLAMTSVITYHPSDPVRPASNVRVFELQSNIGLDTVTPTVFDTDTKTNRSIWETVSTRELHAGLQTVQPEAWIPAHAHDTEELITVISGLAVLYDKNGVQTELRQGSMIHIEKKSHHAIRNIATDEPLVLMWAFPARFGFNKFQFRNEYKTT